MSDWLPVAVRAYALPPADLLGEPKTTSSRSRRVREPTHVLVLDTETTTDPTQALQFGCWRLYDVLDDGRLACVHEGIFHADDLEETDPSGYEVLRRYGRNHRAAVDLTRPFANWELHVVSRREFLDRVLYKAAYEKPRTAVVAFNFPFDITRLAVHAGAANYYTRRVKADPAKKRHLSSFAGGFSVQLWDFHGTEHSWRPRIGIKTIDSKRALKGFRSPAEIDDEDLVDGKVFNGHFLDARTLTFALTNESHTLESASAEFEVPYTKRNVTHGTITEEYVTYCREDVEATANLYASAMEEYRLHPIALQATKAFSPASIAKAYLRAMGIKPVLERQKGIDPKVLGWAMSTFYGGRAECRIRKVPVPVELVDFTSMYPTVDALMGLWSLLTTSHITTKDDTAGVQALLETVDLERCFDPDTWPEFVGIAQILPEDDLLPCRAQYGPEHAPPVRLLRGERLPTTLRRRRRAGDGPSWNIGINHLTSRQPMWFTIADLVASKVLTGKTPQVIQALRFVPGKSQLRGLKTVRLRGSVEVDPASMDFFTSVVEERQRIKTAAKDHEPRCTCAQCRTSQFLKVLANSGSYGIYAEMVRHELGGSQDTVSVDVFGAGPESFQSTTTAPETPGEFCFPPIAACITGAARLMLALLEALVVQAGGSWAMCDTDSMAIVADESGSLVPCAGGHGLTADGRQAIRALSFAQVESIRNRFASLHPYATDAVPGTILKSEEQALCYVISAKRYALYHVVDGRVTLSTKKPPSEHGLGHLADPSREDHSEDEPEGEDPTDDEVLESRALGRPWIAEAWRWLLSEEEGLEFEEPAWLDRLAISRLAISSPMMLRPFEGLNKGKDYREQIKPYNFMLAAHVAPFGHPPGVDPARFRLVAPFEPLALKWASLPWRNLYDRTEQTYSITTTSSLAERGEPDEVGVQTLRDVLREYRNHPEAKSLGPDGKVCGRPTRGLLARRPVEVSLVHYIGKEANRLEDVEAGLVGDLDEVLTEYIDPAQDMIRTLVLPVLEGLSSREVGRRIDEEDHKKITRIRNGSRPRREMIEKLLTLATDIAASQPVEERSPEASAILAEVKVRTVERGSAS